MEGAKSIEREADEILEGSDTFETRLRREGELS